MSARRSNTPCSTRRGSGSRSSARGGRSIRAVVAVPLSRTGGTRPVDARPHLRTNAAGARAVCPSGEEASAVRSDRAARAARVRFPAAGGFWLRRSSGRRVSAEVSVAGLRPRRTRAAKPRGFSADRMEPAVFSAIHARAPAEIRLRFFVARAVAWGCAYFDGGPFARPVVSRSNEPCCSPVSFSRSGPMAWRPAHSAWLGTSRRARSAPAGTSFSRPWRRRPWVWIFSPWVRPKQSSFSNERLVSKRRRHAMISSPHSTLGRKEVRVSTLAFGRESMVVGTGFEPV